MQDTTGYVCITHHRFCPCYEGEYHLLSNWVVDINRIRILIEKEKK